MINYLILFLFLAIENHPMDFKSDQLKYSRVRTAYSEKEEGVKKLLSDQSLDIQNFQLYIQVFKKEKTLKVWAAETGKGVFCLLAEYPVCMSSGFLGPKRKQGDLQVPEGLYHIDRYNPASNYYLSLGINYPNKSDRILGDKTNPGGDIFIHGNCVTIGCVPITDYYIKELYVLAVEAKNNGQDKIPVHIFPFQLTDENFDTEKLDHSHPHGTVQLWSQLKNQFVYFSENRKILRYSIDDNGYYKFEQ